jgi:hypothetical protein
VPQESGVLAQIINAKLARSCDIPSRQDTASLWGHCVAVVSVPYFFSRRGNNA